MRTDVFFCTFLNQNSLGGEMSSKQRKDPVSTHHSFIRFSNGDVKKLIEPQTCLSLPEQEALIADMLEFRRRLLASGIPIAVEYELAIQEEVIVERTMNCGVDGYRMLKVGTGSTAEMVLTQIVRGLRPILLQPEITLVPDPHPANWCFDGDGVGRYIDFQPARFQRSNGLKLVGFPQPTGEEYEWSVGRYYSKIGLVRILRFNAIRAGGPGMRDLLTEILVKEIPGNLPMEIQAKLNNLPGELVRRGELSAQKAINDCGERDIDDIREIAMVVAEQQGGDKATLLSNVLEYTRADFGVPTELRKLRVEQAKTLVLQEL